MSIKVQLIKEGITSGEAEGEVVSRLESKVMLLLGLKVVKLGSPTEDDVERVQSVSEVDLGSLAKLVLSACKADEIFLDKRVFS